MSGINWQDFPPKDPPASPTEVAQIVSDAVDREYIYCRQFSLELLAKEESWSQHHFDKLTDKGKIEVTVWLKAKNPQLSHTISSSTTSSLPRRSVDPLCSGCKEKVAGYPEAPHSIYCSKDCRKSNRPAYHRFGPIHASAPSQLNGSITHHPDSFIELPLLPIEELLATPPVEEEESPVRAAHQDLLTEWVDKLTVGQLKSLMGAQHISRPKSKDIRKHDLVAAVIEYYLEKSWEQFKNDLLSIGCQLANIDLI